MTYECNTERSIKATGLAFILLSVLQYRQQFLVILQPFLAALLTNFCHGIFFETGSCAHLLVVGTKGPQRVSNITHIITPAAA